MNYLKQSTAITLKIGPFLDSTDGYTAETGLTITQASVRLSKNGGDIAQKNESSAAIHDEIGVYGCSIDATDTATLGRLQLWVHVAGALPVWHEFMVVTSNVYDALCGTDVLQSDLIQIGGVAQSATDLKDLADAGYDPATHKVQGVALVDTTTTTTDMRGTDNAALASTLTTHDGKLDTVDANVDAVLIDTGTDIPARLTGIEGATFLSSTDSLEAIRNRGDAAWTTGAGGSSPTVEEIRIEMDTNSVDLNAILADTNELQTNQSNWLTATGFATAAALTTHDGKLDTVDANVDAVLIDIAALNDITVSDIIAGVTDGTFDLQEMMRLILAATAGKSSGGGTDTLIFRDAADTKARITATVDANGNRTAMTLDGA